MALAYETIDLAIVGHVLTITLNRPDKANALNRLMVDELLDAFDRSDCEPDVRAVIVTGAGRHFCGGFELEGSNAFDVGAGDIDWRSLPADHAVRDLGGRLTLRIFNSLKPVIAAVNGAAVGIGATMLLPMDVRIASHHATLGFVFTRRGIVPEACSSWFLPRVVGINHALDWTMSGRAVPADEAREAGLFKSVHPGENLLAAAQAVAADLAGPGAPVSVALTRQMMWHGLTMDHPMAAHRVESRLMAMRGAHQDAHEGVASFLGRRAPDFPGRVPDDLPPGFPCWPERQFY